MKKISLSAIKQYNIDLRKNNGVSSTDFSQEEIAAGINEDKDKLFESVSSVRSLTRTNKAGKRVAPSTASFSQFLTARYGITVEKEELQKNGFAVFKKYLQQLGVDSSSMTLSDLSVELGGETLSKTAVEELLNTDIKGSTTFIIREVFTEAVRLGMLNNVLHNDWIIRTQTLADLEVKSPQLKKGNARWKFIEEGESIEFGTVQFGQKTIAVRKIGTGLVMTDELVMRSSIDMLVEYVMTVGEDMGLGSDALAINVLKNGEQSDLSESAPIIGSENGTSIEYKDMSRVVGRMRRLGNIPTRIITQEGQGLDLTMISEIKGFDGMKVLTSFNNGIHQNLPAFNNDIHGLTTSGTAIFLAPNRCMLKLAFRPMKTERRRNPKTQEEEIYFSDWIGFSIVRRDARVIVNKALAFSGNGFPSYMDVDSYQNNPFVEA